jgi:hypothetical protein
MKRELFDIWEQSGYAGVYPWRVQLVNYVGTFETRRDAEKFIESTKKARVLAAKDAGVAAVPIRKSK